MNGEDIDRLHQQASVALYDKRDYKEAFRIYKTLSDNDSPSAHLMCGLILENGWINGIKDLDGALPFYEKLAVRWDDDEGYLGIARIAIEKRDTAVRGKAYAYCDAATHGKSRRAAFILLGRLYEEMTDPPNRQLARKFYMKGFLAGSAWALRKYSSSLMLSGNYIGGALVHFVAAVLSPFMILIVGREAVRQG